MLVNVVSALAQCRIDCPYFHRSVYRHAQALCWAPIFLNSDNINREGSLQILPPQKACMLRGCNSNSPCVKSAVSILRVLFEKKRSHLCNVWVTTTSSPSPFEEINRSAAKYGALQIKYLRAYVDCLLLSQERATLETLASWTRSIKRDYCGYFYVSAAKGGKHPNFQASKDNLLQGAGFNWFAKRYINQAISRLLKVESLGAIKDPTTNIEDEKFQSIFESMYECFQRLNISIDDLDDVIAKNNAIIPEVEALITGYRVSQHSREEALTSFDSSQEIPLEDKRNFVKEAAEYFKDSFSRQSLLKQRRALKRKASIPEVTDNDMQLSDCEVADKGKATEENDANNVPQTSTIKKYFTVNVPVGLPAGSTFTASIRHGGFTKKVKLKVPTNEPKRLRFCLEVPRDDSEK